MIIHKKSPQRYRESGLHKFNGLPLFCKVMELYNGHMNYRNEFCLAIVLAGISLSAFGGHLRLVSNPYARVAWDRVTQHKANLHTHTIAGGGQLFLRQAYEEYARNGYTVLAITDHNLFTAWGRSDIDPLKEFGILQVKGQEYSDSQHVNGLFVDSAKRTKNINSLIRNVGLDGGFAVLNHPGRYWATDVNGLVPPETLARYRSLFSENPCLLGIEVINANNRFAYDFDLWDALLGVFMPERPVWGFANDDMHQARQIAKGWEVLLLEALNEKEVRSAMTTGSFYFSARPPGLSPTFDNEPPVIISLTHDPDARTLNISAAADGEVLAAGHYLWVAEGRTLCEGSVLDYGKLDDSLRYVRAEVSSQGGKTYTNPFGFMPAVK